MNLILRKGTILSFLIAALGGAALAVAQQPPETDRDPSGRSQNTQLHYHNGKRYVELTLAFDELAVQRGHAPRLPLKQLAGLAPGGVVEELPGGDALLHYAAPAADRAALGERAQAARGHGFAVAAVAYLESAPRNEGTRVIIPNRLTLKLKEGVSLEETLQTFDLDLVEEVGFSPDTYIVETTSDELLAGLETANTLYEQGWAVFAAPLVKRQQQPRLAPNDALYPNQWHLNNTGTQVTGAVAGNDVNIEPVWDSYTGAGINIAITDTGVELTHSDLQANIRSDIDIDINGNDNDPTAQFNSHGTSVAGVAAAVGQNNIGVAGAAFDAGIVAIRLIEGATDDQDEAAALGHQSNETNPADFVHLNNNSWGPADCGCQLGDFLGPLTPAALENGVTNGRGGLGTVYVWAGGNGRTDGDNVNYDAYASSRYTIAVGASGADGEVSYYSEPGASLLVNTPSSFSGGGITTTKFSSSGNPPSDYTTNFGGTSSASPLAAGVIALMLQANPNLGWRDVQHILVDTSTVNDPSDLGWVVNNTGRLFNVNYGFGRIDADAAVTRAETWVPVPGEATPLSGAASPMLFIPDNDSVGVQSTLSFSGVPDDFFVEHVEIDFNATHPNRGDLFINLRSPAGTNSVMATVHNDSKENYAGWTFTSVANWGEHPEGTWKLFVKDLRNQNAGTFDSWTLRVYGFLTDSANVYVDSSYASFEHGTVNRPYNTLSEGVAAVSVGGTVHLPAGDYGEVAVISKPLHITAEGGTVRLKGP